MSVILQIIRCVFHDCNTFFFISKNKKQVETELSNIYIPLIHIGAS